MNNLDPEVAEHPEDLVVYGGTGRAARSWEAFDATAGRRIGASRDLVLGPGEWRQVDGVLGDFLLRAGYLKVSRVSGNGRFLAYAVLNDGPAPGGPGTHDGSYVAMEAAE